MDWIYTALFRHSEHFTLSPLFSHPTFTLVVVSTTRSGNHSPTTMQHSLTLVLTYISTRQCGFQVLPKDTTTDWDGAGLEQPTFLSTSLSYIQSAWERLCKIVLKMYVNSIFSNYFFFRFFFHSRGKNDVIIQSDADLVAAKKGLSLLHL